MLYKAWVVLSTMVPLGHWFPQFCCLEIEKRSISHAYCILSWTSQYISIFLEILQMSDTFSSALVCWQSLLTHNGIIIHYESWPTLEICRPPNHLRLAYLVIWFLISSKWHSNCQIAWDYSSLPMQGLDYLAWQCYMQLGSAGNLILKWERESLQWSCSVTLPASDVLTFCILAFLSWLQKAYKDGPLVFLNAT